MKTAFALTTSTLLFITGNISLADNGRHTDFAHVTQVTPIIKTIEQRVPQERCWVEQVSEEHQYNNGNKSATGTIVGGIIGGAIGNKVGHDSGNKRVGTVVGALLGMSVGNDISRTNRHQSQPAHVSYRDVERCEVTHNIETKQITESYNVNYNYQGFNYSTRMNTHPGKRIKVMVNVQPVSM